MNRRRFLALPAILLALVAIGVAAPSSAQTPSWQLLGSSRLATTLREVTVTLTPPPGPLTTLGIRVTGNDLPLASLRLTGAGGETFEVALEGILRQGDVREIDVAGATWPVATVALVYGRPPNLMADTVVEILGR